MKIRNKRSGREFEIKRDEWENVFVAKGNAENYEIIEDEAPLEVRSMRAVIEIKKKQSRDEIKPEINKQND